MSSPYEEPIPADLTNEDAFYGKMSVRQVVTLGLGIFLWLGASKGFLSGIIGLAFPFALIATIWIPAVGVALAFVTINGRPVDLWIGQKLAFKFGKQTYLLRDIDAGGLEADLSAPDERAEWVQENSNGPRVLSRHSSRR